MFEDKKIMIGCGAALLLVLIVAGVLLFFARGKKETSNTGKPITLTLWTPLEDSSVYDPFIKSVEEIGVTLDVVKKDSASYEEEVINAIAGGKGPDIWLLRNDWFPKHRDKLIPLASDKQTIDNFKSDFAPVVGEEVIVDGKIYGVPLSADPLVLFTNNNLYAKGIESNHQVGLGSDPTIDRLANVKPQTWDDFEKATNLLTEKDGEDVKVAGAALGTVSNIDNAVDILYLLMQQNSAEFLSKDQKSAAFHLPVVSQDRSSTYPATKALEFYTNFAKPGKETYSWNQSMPNATTAFAEGKVAMMIAYASTANAVKQANPDLQFSVSPLPQVKQAASPVGFVKYWALAVNRNSKYSPDAWELIKFLSTADSREKYLEATGRYPITRKSITRDNRYDINSQINLAKGINKLDAEGWDVIMTGAIDNVIQHSQAPQISIEVAANQITELISGGSR